MGVQVAVYLGAVAAAAVVALVLLCVVLLVRKLRMRHRSDLQNISRTCTEQGLGEFTAPIDAEARGDTIVAVREWINLERTLAHPKKLVAAFWLFWSNLTTHALKDPDTRQSTIDSFNKLVNATAPSVPAAAAAPVTVTHVAVPIAAAPAAAPVAAAAKPAVAAAAA